MSKRYFVDGVELSANEYLYGKGVSVEPIPEYICMRRIVDLQDHLAELLNHSYHMRTKDSDERVSSVLKAIKHWENINKEEIQV